MPLSVGFFMLKYLLNPVKLMLNRLQYFETGIEFVTCALLIKNKNL